VQQQCEQRNGDEQILMIKPISDFYYCDKLNGELMHKINREKDRSSYLNPVYRHPCPDPFVLKYMNEYWAYCTGFWPDGLCFGVLYSPDLINWQALGGAMKPLDAFSTCYWAPEVRYDNGRFLMYYSVGDEANMQIRVAVAEHPAGPFIDCGERLTSETFAIDPHVFEDEDGVRYLFYATDFLTHERVGTGTVVDLMLDPMTLAGRPRPVTRARYDWQTYDPHRIEKGGVHWHTVEGPFVLKHKGRYYQMFSAGNWKNESYGVSYGMTDDLRRADEWLQAADAEKVFPILRTLPGHVTGPGHNSVVRGPDNRQLFCVYHCWDNAVNDRVMAIDRLEWVGDRMLILGPSTSPQPQPNRPTITNFFGSDTDEKTLQTSSGKWSVQDNTIMQTAMDSSAEARCLIASSFFILELSLRLLDAANRAGAIGIKLQDEQGVEFYFGLISGGRQTIIRSRPSQSNADDAFERSCDLPQDFQSDAYHSLRVEANGPRISLALDDHLIRWEAEMFAEAKTLVLTTENASAAFAGFTLTLGWEDLFNQCVNDPVSLGWQVESGDSDWRIMEAQLICDNAGETPARLIKGEPLRQYEMVVNAKLGAEVATDSVYGFLPAIDLHGLGPLVTIERDESGYMLKCDDGQSRIFRLRDDFDPHIYQQFRFRKEQGRLLIQHEAQVLGAVELPDIGTRVGLYVYKAIAAFDMVRVTFMS
jgi:GH43 family beta-xylosidase